MFKKVISMLIVLTMVLSLSVGCSKPQETTPPAATPGETTPPAEEMSSDLLVWNMAVDPQNLGSNTKQCC